MQVDLARTSKNAGRELSLYGCREKSYLSKYIKGGRQGAEPAGGQVGHDYRVNGASHQVGGLRLLPPGPTGVPTGSAGGQHVALQRV